MSDISKINVDGIDYDLKDEVARANTFGTISNSDLFEWASSQTYGGSFEVSSNITPNNLPASGWFCGNLIVANNTCKSMLLFKASTGALYITSLANNKWNSWKTVSLS